MRNATLLFLVKKSEGKITDICLAMKKRGFGIGHWNGVGGKVNDGETIEVAALREAHEEIGVRAKNIRKVAELAFTFPQNSAWDQLVHTYFTSEWDENPTESEEMSPKWFKVSDIPYDDMWPDDKFWLPRVLKGELIKARFTFIEKEILKDREVSTIEKFD